MSAAAVHLLLPQGVPGRVTKPVCNGECRFFGSAFFLGKSPAFGPKRISLICGASPNNHRGDSDFSRKQKGFPGGKRKPSEEQDDSENIDESDVFPSKNGPLLSLTNKSRSEATQVPGEREDGISLLFRRVQANVRAKPKRANEEEKKPDSAKGQGEMGAVDPILKLQRKHPVDQRSRKSSEREPIADQTRKSNDSGVDQISNILRRNRNTEEKVDEPAGASIKRPASIFRRKSPVPRVKFQPIFHADEDADAHPDDTISDDDLPKSEKTPAKKQPATYKSDSVLPPEDISLNDFGDLDLDDEPDASDTEESPKGTVEPSLEGPDVSDAEQSPDDTVQPPSLGSSDIGSLKVTELRELAKSRGIKGYSKMKKTELVDLLSGTA